MMPYKGTYLRLFSLLLKKPMTAEYGKELTRKTLKAAPAVYRRMLEQVDDIGADNPMAGNIYMCFVFLAIWKAADGAISPDSLRRVTKAFMARPIVAKIMSGKDINKPEDLAAAKNRFRQMQAWADAHPEYK
ncbi:MAG: L-2-amino-thiazoline-4-carboxylic acid hydrolase, partial [Clostridia bacterium]|nr:L-2-amino-thiazoline-4-carboxylic acid hydrolase [Clostridia bacterium]